MICKHEWGNFTWLFAATSKVFREHPFNLKGWAMVFFEVEFFFSLRSQAEIFFSTSCRNIIFFSTKRANRIFFSAHVRDKKKP